MIKHCLILTLLLFYPLNALSSDAQDKKDETQQKKTGTQEQEAPIVDENAIKLFLDKIQVEGRLEKPQAVFIIPGTDPEIDDIRIERSFFEEIFRPVEKKGRVVLQRTSEKTQTRKDYIPW